MANLIESSLVIRKESIYDRIRKNLCILIYRRDYLMMQRLDELMKTKRPNPGSKIVIPKEIGRDFIKQ